VLPAEPGIWLLVFLQVLGPSNLRPRA